MSAVKDDEHAVSTAILGPVRLRQKETLSANIDAVMAVDENWSILLKFDGSTIRVVYSKFITPKKTPVLHL